MDYKELTTFEKRKFVSRVVDFLLYSPYFYRDLMNLIDEHSKKEEVMQGMRRREVPIREGNVPSLLPKAAQVQPKEDFTKTSQYQAIREERGVLPFEKRVFDITSNLRSKFTGLFS
jgi:hypothetical protein